MKLQENHTNIYVVFHGLWLLKFSHALLEKAVVYVWRIMHKRTRAISEVMKMSLFWHILFSYISTETPVFKHWNRMFFIDE